MQFPRLNVRIGCVFATEESVVQRKRESYRNESDGENDDRDGDRRDFVPAIVFLVPSSGGELLLGVLHGDSELPPEDGVAQEETHAGNYRVDERDNLGKDIHPKVCIVGGSKRTPLARTVL